MSEMKPLGHTIEEYMEVFWLAVFDAAADFPIVSKWLQRLKNALNIAKISAQQLSKYLGSIRVADDTKMAMAIGVVVGAATIALLAYYPGNDFNGSENKALAEKSSRKKGKKEKTRNTERLRCSDLSGESTSIASKREAEVQSNDDLGEGATGRADEKAAVFLKGLASMKDEIMETRQNASGFNLATTQNNNKGLRRRGKGGKSNIEDNVRGESTKGNTSSSAATNDDDDDDASSDDDEGKGGTPSNPFDNPVVEAKARKAAKLLGLSEAQYQEAKTNAKTEYETGKSPDDSDHLAENLSACANFAIMGTLLVLTIWAINRDYGNAATKFFIANFPREAITLGIISPLEDPHAD